MDEQRRRHEEVEYEKLGREQRGGHRETGVAAGRCRDARRLALYAGYFGASGVVSCA
jgi:hypothetical protein